MRAHRVSNSRDESLTHLGLALYAAEPTLKPMDRRVIPPGSETMVLPCIGKVVVFREGPAWFAVRPDFEEVPDPPSGIGGTMGEAVAELVAAEG